MISELINKYIENSKVNGIFIKWDKQTVNIYIMPIVACISDRTFYMSEIQRAVLNWNKILKECFIALQFNLVSNASDADIVIHWTKVGRVFEGMCKYSSIIGGIIKKVAIDIGLPNSCSPKNTTNESIFATMMHELGHSLGLGHGIDVDDIMFVPHQKNIFSPSENDLFVLKTIYLSKT